MMIRFLVVVFILVFSAQSFSQNHNPFDLPGRDSLTQSEQPEIKDSNSLKDEIKIEGENPFTVSHIPIRKNQYEQIEKLTIQDRGAQENISITYLPLWIVVLSLCLLAFVLIRKKNHIFRLIRCIFNNNLLRSTAYEENSGLSVVYLSGYFLFIVNVALFLYLVSEKALEFFSGFSFFWILLACMIFFWGKHVVLALISRLYDFEKEATVYSFTIMTLNNLLALVFLSLNIILLFGSDNWIRALAIAGIAVFLLFLLVRYYKGLTIARKYLNEAFFHFFLYFCAFEFSPWMVVYSLFRDFI